MNRNPQNSSPVHAKIVKLLESLNEKSEQQEDGISPKLQKFRESIFNHQELLQERFNSLSSALGQMEKDSKAHTHQKRVRMIHEHEENMQQSLSENRDNFERCLERIESEKRIRTDQVLLQKMKLTQQEELFRNQIVMTQKQLHEGMGILKNQLKHHDKEKIVNFKEFQIKSKIQSLNRQVTQTDSDDISRKSLFKQKQKSLENLIKDEEETLNKNFDMHCQTLQKLISKISERII